MREVGTFEAKTHLSALLDEVACGETIIITKRGRAVARLTPPEAPDRAVAIAAATTLRALCKPIGWATPEDILQMRYDSPPVEGHLVAFAHTIPYVAASSQPVSQGGLL